MSQRRLGKYELQERIGLNATSETWKAVDTQTQRIVALKVIEVQPSSDFLSRFPSQAQAIMALHHPNIVEVLEAFVSQQGTEAYIVTEYVEGPSLQEYLDATAHKGKIPTPEEIVRVLTPVAAALDYAHQHRVLHGALKPTAILFDTRRAVSSSPGEPVLTKFGIHQQRDPRTLSSGDASYIAPEVAQGHAGMERSDLYALGIMLYELCTGTLPFQDETTNDILMQHIHAAPTAPTLINPGIRPALSSVILRSIAKEPSARFASATALVTAVARALNVPMPAHALQPNLVRGIITPPSFTGISDLESMNSATSISPLPQSFGTQAAASLAPPIVASSNTPLLPPPPVPPTNTPVLNDTSSILQGRTTIRVGDGTHTPVGQDNVPLAPVVSPARSRRRLSPRLIVLAVILELMLLGMLVGTFLLMARLQNPSSASNTPIVGHAFFVSSGLIAKNSSRGITDKLQIDLRNVPSAQAGKRYYGWLLAGSNEPDATTLALGPLTVNQGRVLMTYSGESHDNLLAKYSRFLITEEDASQQPVNPSLDTRTWRYYDAFSTAPNLSDPKKYSLFNHLQHLLSQDPKLSSKGLSGGLDTWLFRNTMKILEAAGSARDQQKVCVAQPSTACTNFMLRQVARILDYLDGSTYVKNEGIPTNIQDIQAGQLLIDPITARVAILEFEPTQDPPGYLKHIGSHLESISLIADSTPEQRSLAIRINQAINNVQGWLHAVRADAAKLIHMNSDELLRSDALNALNDLFIQANNAFVGQVDPNTNNVDEGVVQIHYNVQALATFDVARCTSNAGKSSCA